MKISKSSRRVSAAASVLAVSALALAACGAAPSQAGKTDDSSAPKVDYTACMVSDEGGFDDRSFNQASFEGLKAAEKDLNITVKSAESNAKTDMKPNIESMVSAKCNMVVTAGFNIGDATKEAALKYPDTDFAIVDVEYGADRPANVRSLMYKTDEAAFLAGYAAAAYSKTGKVGTFGGAEIPTVTIFMQGFLDGVNYYNEKKGKSVKVIGWGDSKSFVSDFTNANKARQIADNQLADGVDVIMPVAGPLGQAAVDAVNASSSADDAVVWVDTDGYDYAKDGKAVVLTSVMKQMAVTVEESIKAGVDKTFKGEDYVGTLENGGVGLAPFHDFASKVPADLQSEIDQLSKDIVAGTVKVSK